MGQTLDLRGRTPIPPVQPVLADPSGRRARRLARAGRIVAAIFLIWLVGLALAGLGILPDAYVPFSPAIDGASVPRPAINGRLSPTTADHVTAGSAVSARPTAVRHHSAAGPRIARRKTSPAAGATPGRHLRRRAAITGTPVTRIAPAGSGQTTIAGGSAATASHAASARPSGKLSAPGQTRKLSAPGQTKTARGRSSTAPGTVKKTASLTTPGRSGVSPGHTITHGTGGVHSH